jgi:hypothetical protein
MWTLGLCQVCTSLQNLAQSAMPLGPTGPTAGLGAALIASPRGFALFRDAKRVGGRGISDFLPRFFFAVLVFAGVQLQRNKNVARAT